MDTAIVRFKQRNILVTVRLALHSDYVEYAVSGTRSNNIGFNTRYELLPNAFDYRTLREPDMFVLFPLVIVAGMTLFELALPQNPVYPLLLFMFLFGLLGCGVGYVLRRLLRREYTVLATPSGKLTIVKDRQHDLIVQELAMRRGAALRRAAVVNPSAPPWAEVKKFRWLKDQGAISDEEFMVYRERILSAAEGVGEKTVRAIAVH